MRKIHAKCFGVKTFKILTAFLLVVIVLILFQREDGCSVKYIVKEPDPYVFVFVLKTVYKERYPQQCKLFYRFWKCFNFKKCYITQQ